MRVALGSDHAGYRYKMLVAKWLRDHGHEVEDFGTSSEESVDYPDFVVPAARAVAQGRCERGVVFGGSGNGEAIAANKIRGVRCTLCWNEDSARYARMHNDANVLSIGQRLVSEEMVPKILEVWMTTPFEGGRHVGRVAKLNALGGP